MSGTTPWPGMLAVAALATLAAAPVRALVYSVTDFRPDQGAAGADTARLDSDWGDSLFIAARDHEFQNVLVRPLDDGRDPNGNSAASPMVSATGQGTFSVGYVAWSVGHKVPWVSGDPGRGDVVIRTAVINPDTFFMPTLGTRIATNENIPDPFSPKKFYNGSNFKDPPTYFNFSAEGTRFAAYWGSLIYKGPYRRATHLNESGIAGYVTPTVPAISDDYGAISSALVPGTGGVKTLLAYQTTFGGGNYAFDIRWENLSTGASNAVTVVRTSLPEDFAVAADSNENALVLWRQADSLYVTAYDAARVRTVAPTLVQAGIYSMLPPDVHFYRPYGIVSLGRLRFMVAYGRAGKIYYRTLTLSGAGSLTAGTETALTPGATGICMFPNITDNPGKILIGWFENKRPNFFAVKGAVFDKLDDGLDPATRQDLDLTTDEVSFQQSGGQWVTWHYFKVPALAMDDRGNIVTAYDQDFNARVSLIRNSSIYYDSAEFLSKPLPVQNPGIAYTFDPLKDSVAFISLNGVDATAKIKLQLAVSATGTFTDPGSGFRDLIDTLKMATGYFRYRAALFTTPPGNYTTPKLKSLSLRYNVKPQVPAIDSIKIGSGSMAAFNASTAYVLLPRKDSLKLVCSGLDVDDGASLEFRLETGDGAPLKQVTSAVKASGIYRSTLALMPPDSLSHPLTLRLTTRDGDGWQSNPRTVTFDFRNRAPVESLTVIRARGRDSAGVFILRGGGSDTLRNPPAQPVVLQLGDSALARVNLADGNDDSLDFAWLRSAASGVNRRVATRDTLTFRFAADIQAPLTDTLTLRVSDRHDSAVFRLPFRPNRLPAIDSVLFAAYKGKDSVRRTGSFDKVKDFAADTGILVPAGLPAVLRAGFSDPDIGLGDAISKAWAVLKPRASCTPVPGTFACYDTVATATGDSLARTFSLGEEYLVLRVTDTTGAFLQRRLRLELPVIDTSASGPGSLRAAAKVLSEDLSFILDSQVKSREVSGDIASRGSVPLSITSAATGRNDQKWLELKLNWVAPGSPPRPDSLRLRGNTQINPVPAGSPLSVASGEKLTLTFRFFTDSLRGDSVFTDTLFLATNDFSNPVLKVPFRVVYNDLPLLRLTLPGAPPGNPQGGFNASGLPPLLPDRTNLAFGFSETVRVPDPYKIIRIYSYLDSLKNPRGYRNVGGVFDYRRKPTGAGKVSGVRMAAGVGSATAWADSLADTLVFIPRYDAPSDSLKVKPAPGYFLHRDVLRIAISNGITDRAGNGLDLRLDRVARPPGALDTIFQIRIDTGYFRVTSTTPSGGAAGWDPDQPIRVRFNRRLALPPPQGGDTLTALNLRAFKGDSNAGIRVISKYRPRQRYDFQFLTLADGDSSLVFKGRPRFPALDSVTVTLSAGLTDTGGLTLDGNQDGTPARLYDSADSSDNYSFSFQTLDQEFYVYPNPYRFSDARHRDKGSVTFKNLNSLRGYRPEREVVLRIHTLTGDLIYSSRDGSDLDRGSTRRGWTSLDWDLKNGSGNLVGTGVYMFTLISGKESLLRKGKVAVIR